jgi:exodeoxyribonuclease VII small subunit
MNKSFMQFDYTAKTTELEGILAQLQDENIQLDTALRLHKTGTKLIAEIEEYLKEAENEVKKQLTKES